MSAEASIPLAWAPREPPLEPEAVIAFDEVATRLGRRVLAAPEGLSELRGCAGPSSLLLIGPPESLPWVDGVRYLGRDPRAPSLLVPTTLTTQVPPDLLARAVSRQITGAAAVLPGTLLDASAAGPIDVDALTTWLASR